jgi:protein SCO1/2
MKKFIISIFTFSVVCMLHAQNYLKESNFNKKVEIGIVEKLGNTIPMNLKFLNENNDTVSLGQLINKPTILSFVYFDCVEECSTLLDGVADMVSKLDFVLGKDYQIITISFDTKDNPKKAESKKSNFIQKINKENQQYWTFLTGKQEDIIAITSAVGYNFISQGLEFAHPSAIIVVSPAGKITRYLYGLVYLPFDVKMALIEAQKGIARPTINKVLEYCFAYNPSSKTYTLQITRIVGTLTLIIAAIVFVILVAGRRKRNKNL